MLKYLLTFGILLCCQLPLDAKETLSTNPCRPFVDEFQLPNYDLALDTIDYSQPYEKIDWPWMAIPEQKKKHDTTIEWIRQNTNTKLLRIDSSRCRNLTIWPIWDEWCESYEYSPENVDDSFLTKTLPFLPEVSHLALKETNVTDEGLKNIFYCPRLQWLNISTSDKITYNGIATVCQHPNLSYLIINGKVNTKIIQSIGNYAKNIIELIFDGTCDDDTDFSHLRSQKRIRGLYFYFTPSNLNNTVTFWEAVKNMPMLQKVVWDGVDFSETPDTITLDCISSIKKYSQLNYLKLTKKVHPVLIKNLCEIKSLREVAFFQVHIRAFTPEKPICYERVMYELYKRNAVPEYYQKLEQEFAEELKWHTWEDKKGKELRAKLVKIGKKKVSLEKEDGTVITISRSSLCKDDQLYLKELERLEKDKMKEDKTHTLSIVSPDMLPIETTTYCYHIIGTGGVGGFR